MVDVIQERDPRGIKVFCSKFQWDNHIVEDSGHPIMRDNVDAIRETIAQPDYIYESHDSNPPLDYREVYSKKSTCATYYNTNAPYTKVIVSVLGGSGEIVTAYPARDPYGGTKGEAIYCAKSEG